VRISTPEHILSVSVSLSLSRSHTHTNTHATSKFNQQKHTHIHTYSHKHAFRSTLSYSHTNTHTHTHTHTPSKFNTLTNTRIYRWTRGNVIMLLTFPYIKDGIASQKKVASSPDQKWAPLFGNFDPFL